MDKCELLVGNLYLLLKTFSDQYSHIVLIYPSSNIISVKYYCTHSILLTLSL